MTKPHPTTRRGVALLLVLAALVVTVTAAATLSRVAATTKLQRQADRAALTAHDLLGAVETPIRYWLEAASGTVVLPPDTDEPRVEIINESWTVDETVFEVAVTAWDQCGMVPLERARSGSPLRLALPPAVRDVLGRVTVPSREPAGLDHFAGTVDTSDALVLFPEREPAAPEPFGAPGAADPVAPDTEDAPTDLAPRPVALGALVATHSPLRVNVYTAPPALLEAAYRATGRGGLQNVLEARAAGEPAPLETDASSDSSPDRERSPGRLQLVSASPAWAFRIDLRVGGIARSWWSIYVQSESSWECVQRLAVID